MSQPAAERIYVVDRVEGRGANAMVVLVSDEDEQLEVSRAVLGAMGIEGAVLRVPLRDAAPDWTNAVRDRAEERRRTAGAEELLKRLSARDPGGDLEL